MADLLRIFVYPVLQPHRRRNGERMAYKLTVALITMNRAEQLRRAIETCAAARLPKDTQFVIVDNASTDDTAAVVQELKGKLGYDLIYRKEEQNRGVGGGRNICFDLAEGEYIYFYDDDAEIPQECRETFFVKSIDFMDANPTVAVLTTNVVDEVFGARDIPTAKNRTVGGLGCVYTFHGGTSFARRSCFQSPMFMNIMYANEEIAVAMGAFDKGYCIAYMPDIYIDHKPKINKWNEANKARVDMQGISNIYAIKRLLYPRICTAVLYAAYRMRISKCGIKDKALVKEFKAKRKGFMKEYSLKRVKLKTVLDAYREFGLSVF